LTINKYRHIFLHEAPGTFQFTKPTKHGSSRFIPDRDPASHSATLIKKFNDAWMHAEDEQAVLHRTRNGVYIEFISDPDAYLVTKSLEEMRTKKIRLLNVRTEEKEDEEITYATVYVAHDKKRYFLDKIEAYAIDTADGKRKNARLVNSIADLRKALLVESFWIDSRELIPADEKVWCEVWLGSDDTVVLGDFEILLEQENIQASAGFIRFPERMVKVILANRHDLETLTKNSDYIAEYRRAKETAAFWLDMPNREQAEWVRDLLKRIEVISDPAVSVCVLDTGINNGHPLLAPVLKDEDCMAVNPNWGLEDHDMHGTLMAGIAAYGDLQKCLTSRSNIPLSHCLESVKIIPRPPGENRQELWGYITSQAISIAEIQAPLRSRIHCMAISATDTRDKGRPSSWSGQVDNLASGAEDGNQRLIIVCAGNVNDLACAVNYPDAQVTESIHDPGQAWNALTIGAYTDLDVIKNETLRGFSPIASAGQLSPFTTTSITWDNKWPNKPDVVLEGGNLSQDGKGFIDESDDLSLLSTFYKPTISHFRSHNMTSAATAKAAWLAARIKDFYPECWPETIRALIVHSAEWTDGLKKQFLGNQSKTAYAQLIRICGYGVPDLNRALYSAENSLTLVSQAYIQPYDKKPSGGGYRTNEMHLFDLPWPKEVLLALPPNIKVNMKVTLSYFIEPGPGEIGWENRYRYPSHGLRFDIKSPSETNDEFIRRINTAVHTEEEGAPGTKSASDKWLIGSNGRDKGSIHSDIWDGTAAELAASGCIAVYPIIGWWRERPYLGRFNRKTRYSLIVSINTPAADVDIYTPVANLVGITVPVTIET
jgi:hypothetical protein